MLIGCNVPVVKPRMPIVKHSEAAPRHCCVCKPCGFPACRFLVQNALRLKQEAGIDFDPAKVCSHEACSSLLCSTSCPRKWCCTSIIWMA